MIETHQEETGFAASVGIDWADQNDQGAPWCTQFWRAMSETTRMTKRRTRILATSLIAVLLSPLGTSAQPASKFIWLSDLHFDSTADPKLIDALAEASVDEWSRILTSSPSGRFSAFGEDTNWALLSSSLAAIRQTAPNVKFTVVTGDILAHRFREKFQNMAKNNDDASFRRFATKTMQFIAAQLGTIAPGKPVLFTLGNNDSDCGDYELQPNGAFLRDGSAVIAQLLGPLTDQTSADDWTALGSYSVPHPSLRHHRVIALNSVYFSPTYQNACSDIDDDPARKEMRWLRSELAKARDHNDKVWLIFHIPPGIDGYATARAKQNGPDKAAFMWKPVYTEAFRKLLKRYHKTITVSLAGHEHMDDFRLITNSLVLMTPALSPIFRQNPAFRVVSFRPDGALSNGTTYYLSNLDEVLNGIPAEWKVEYSFTSTWGLSALDFKNFSKLYREIGAKSAVRDRWSTLYSVSHPQANTITRQSFPKLFCATGNVTEVDFNGCLERIGRQPRN
jgi:sphingomyelin phosphodiesterase acid-like 3